MKKSIKYLKIFANLLVGVLTIVVFLYFAPKLVVFFMPFVVGYLISWIANPVVRFFEKRLKIVRKHGSMIIIIGVLALVILLFYLAGLKITEEVVDFIKNFPDFYENLSEEFETIGDNLRGFLERLPGDVEDTIFELTASLTTYLGSLAQAIGEPTFEAASNFAKNVPGTLIGIIMSILSAYFFTADRDKIYAMVNAHMPESIQKNVISVLKDLKHVVGGYFKAQLKIMVVVYIIVIIGLMILKVDYFLLVGFIIAFLDMLPFFGTGTVLGPWAIIKILSGDYQMAIALILLYVVTQVVRQVIQPKLVGDSIGMNPLATLIFMFIGFKLSGVIGMIVAVPIGMILINLYRAGVFDNQIWCLKELVHDFNEFRKINREPEENREPQDKD